MSRQSFALHFFKDKEINSFAVCLSTFSQTRNIARSLVIGHSLRGIFKAARQGKRGCPIPYENSLLNCRVLPQ